MENEALNLWEKNHWLAEIVVKDLATIKKAEDQNDELINILENFDKQIEDLKADLDHEWKLRAAIEMKQQNTLNK